MILAAIISISLLTFFTVCLVVMLVVIARGGDERRRMIIDKTATTTLKLVVVIQVILSVIHLAEGKDILSTNDTSTFANLTTIAFFFVIGLLYYNRKFKA